jgi:YHS domain-containing protein
VQVDYKLALNLVALGVFVALFALTVRRGATDPVCGMKVDRVKALRRDGLGSAHYFRSAGCADAYDRDPGRYAEARRVRPRVPAAGGR